MMNFFVDLYIILQLLLGAPLDVLVSPDQGLPVWYAPGLNPEAAAALDDMMLAAAEEDVMIWSYSDYRDYAYQQEVDRRESDRQPDRHRSYSAAAGHSEHQLGTAFDVAWPGLPVESREARNLELFDWLKIA
ncbi:MAG: hypothetical protein E4G99_13275 [Anaerolineales bacterium]|nr:MAG: hypothetical protein E4G99_13275 [Anaerolineales bacterium]